MSEITDKTDFSSDIATAVSKAGLKSASDLRKKALASFKETGLPHAKNEEYKFTPITRHLAKQFNASELVQYSHSALDSITEFAIPEVSDQAVVFVNGKFSPTLSSFEFSKEITITPLHEAFEKNSELVLKYFGVHENSEDAFAQLNAAAWQDGLFIHIPKNTQVKQPLFIHHVFDARSSKVAAHIRLLVVAEQGSEFTIVEKGSSVGANAIFNTITEEVVVKENATFTYCKIQNDPGQIYQIANTTIHQSNSSRANTYTFTLDGALIRNNLNILIDGEGCESYFNGLYLTNKSTLVDNHTVVDHRKANSFSNELYKGLMDGNSKGVFNGKIYVRPHAQKTNAFQSNRNILLSDSATINTKPQLEIWADDVKCSHGCTTGQLDEEAVFYLQSRGIPKATAKAMLLYAFAAEVMETINNEKLKSYIDNIISERLHKNF